MSLPAPLVRTWQDLQQNFDWLNSVLKAPYPWYARYTADSGATPAAPSEYIWNDQLTNEHSLTTQVVWGAAPVLAKGIQVNKAGFYEVVADVLVAGAGGAALPAAGRYDVELRVNNTVINRSLEPVHAAGQFSKQRVSYTGPLNAGDVISVVTITVVSSAYDGGAFWSNLTIKRTR